MSDQTQQQTPAVPHRRLVRRPDEKVIAGVCAGFAAYTGVDVVVWRIGFVVLTLASGGVGLIAYIVAIFVMPKAREGEPLPPAPSDSVAVGRWVGIAAIVLGAIVLSGNIWHYRGALIWGLLFIGIGIALWGRELSWGRSDDRPTPPTTTPTTPPPTSPGSDASTTATEPVVPPPPSPPPSSPTEPLTPPPPPGGIRRDASILGRLVVGAAALAVGTAFLLDNLHVIRLTPKGMFTVLVAIAGAGLLIGAWWGRARWLIFPGVALSIALVGSNVMPMGMHGGVGERVWAPTSLSEVRHTYRHFAGNTLINLSRVKFDERPRTINVRQSFGNLEIVVPPDVPVVVSSRLQAGNLELFGHDNNGWDVRDRVTSKGSRKLGTLTLNTRLSFGNTEVRRVQRGEDFTTTNFRFHRMNMGGMR